MSRSFDGSTQWIGATTLVNAVPCTIAFWFNLSALPGTDQVFVCLNDTSANNGFFCTVKSTGALKINQASGGTSGTGASTSTTANTSHWHHGAFVFTANNSRTVYLDGGGSASDSSSVAAPVGISSFLIDFV